MPTVNHWHSQHTEALHSPLLLLSPNCVSQSVQMVFAVDKCSTAQQLKREAQTISMIQTSSFKTDQFTHPDGSILSVIIKN